MKKLSKKQLRDFDPRPTLFKAKPSVPRKAVRTPRIVTDELIFKALPNGRTLTTIGLAQALKMNTPYGREKVRLHVKKMVKARKLFAIRYPRLGMGRKPMVFSRKPGRFVGKPIPVRP